MWLGGFAFRPAITLPKKSYIPLIYINEIDMLRLIPQNFFTNQQPKAKST